MVDVKKTFKAQINTVHKKYTKFLKDPTNPKKILKLRVSIRVARSLMVFFRPLVPRSSVKKIQKYLKCHSKSLSYPRDLDTLMETWIKIIDDPTYTGTNKLQGLIQDQRDTHISQITKDLSEDKLDRDLGKLIKSVDKWSSSKKDLRPYLTKRFNKLNKRVLSGYETLDFGDYKEVHKLRLDMKKIRNIQSRIGFLDKGANFELKAIKNILDDFGQVTDYYAQSAILNDLRALDSDPHIQEDIDHYLDYLDKSYHKHMEQIKNLELGK